MHTDMASLDGNYVPDWARRLTVRPIHPTEIARWNRLMSAHHYLGFRTLVGESLKYVACVDEEWVALLGFASGAFMCRPRDQWIGWSREQQWQRTRYLANNARFLILPAVHIPNLASKVLSLTARRLSTDWMAVHGHTIVAVETFVDPARFQGTAYRAAGWMRLGQSLGFARSAGRYVHHGHPKDYWIYPLRRDASTVLTAPFLSPDLEAKTMTMVDFNAANWVGPQGLRERLQHIVDSRHRRGIRHAQDVVLVLACAAVLAGQRNFIAMSDWIHDLRPEQRERFGCRRWGNNYRVPSEPTIRRTLQQVDTVALDEALSGWLAEQTLANLAVAVDGKTLRGSGHGDTRPVHLLSALVHQDGSVIGQVAVGEKTNEIPKIKDLLDPLDITDAVITADALHTQTETARYLVEDKHAHYVMEVKRNQPSLHDAIATLEDDDFSPCVPHTRQGSRTN